MDYDTFDCADGNRLPDLPRSNACFRNIVRYPRHHHHLGELGICPCVGVKGSTSEERLRGAGKLPSVRRSGARSQVSVDEDNPLPFVGLSQRDYLSH